MKFQQKVFMIVEDTYFEVKNATASGSPSGPENLGLQNNVSANYTNFEEQICQNDPNALH